MELEELFRGRVDLAGVMERLRLTAAELGLPLAERTRTTNSRRAQELGEWAEAQGRGEEFRRAVFHAYFAEGMNIGPEEEIVAVAAGAGLDAAEAREVLRTGRFAGAVDAAWARSRRLGVTSVPTHLLERRLLVGFHRYGELARWAEASGPRPA